MQAPVGPSAVPGLRPSRTMSTMGAAANRRLAALGAHVGPAPIQRTAIVPAAAAPADLHRPPAARMTDEQRFFFDLKGWSKSAPHPPAACCVCVPGTRLTSARFHRDSLPPRGALPAGVRRGHGRGRRPAVLHLVLTQGAGADRPPRGCAHPDGSPG